MNLDSAAPLIVTLEIDAKSFHRFDTLRRQHFPTERNFLPAHLTLFHHLPRVDRVAIVGVLEEEADRQPKMELTVQSVRSLGRGVAFEIASDALQLLHRKLAARWDAWLTPQDRQQFRPHITVQNKVPPEKARALLDEIRAKFVPCSALGEGLLLWEYLGGPWNALGRYSFRGEG